VNPQEGTPEPAVTHSGGNDNGLGRAVDLIAKLVGLFAGAATLGTLFGAGVLILRFGSLDLPWDAVLYQLPREYLIQIGLVDALLPALLVGIALVSIVYIISNTSWRTDDGPGAILASAVQEPVATNRSLQLYLALVAVALAILPVTDLPLMARLIVTVVALLGLLYGRAWVAQRYGRGRKGTALLAVLLVALTTFWGVFWAIDEWRGRWLQTPMAILTAMLLLWGARGVVRWSQTARLSTFATAGLVGLLLTLCLGPWAVAVNATRKPLSLAHVCSTEGVFEGYLVGETPERLYLSTSGTQLVTAIRQSDIQRLYLGGRGRCGSESTTSSVASKDEIRMVLRHPVTVFRVFSHRRYRVGRWVTPIMPPGRRETVRRSLALPNSNRANCLALVTIPRKEPFVVREVAPKFGRPGGWIEFVLGERQAKESWFSKGFTAPWAAGKGASSSKTSC
jgi:hypothetical protein